MSVLVPCTRCRRHIQSDAGACPFCNADVPVDAAARAVPAARSRLDRYAFFTFATTLAAACSAGGTGDLEGGDGGATKQDGSVKDDGGLQAVYGAPADAGPKDDGGMQAAYGISPFDSGGAQPPYGIPPPPRDGGTE